MRQAERSWAPEPSSVSAARRFVDETLTEWGLPDVGWAAAQLVSELATNAVIHAGTTFRVQLSHARDRVRICVADESAAAPALRRYGSDATTGRGMRLVQTLASEWGVEAEGFGKVVWFELPADGRSTVPAWDDGAAVDLDLVLAQLDDETPGTVRALRPGPASSSAVRLHAA